MAQIPAGYDPTRCYGRKGWRLATGEQGFAIGGISFSIACRQFDARSVEAKRIAAQLAPVRPGSRTRLSGKAMWFG